MGRKLKKSRNIMQTRYQKTIQEVMVEANRLLIQQIELLNKVLKSDEEYRQCFDYHSFSGRYFFPFWIVTNYGRIWSLIDQDWITMKPTKNHKYLEVELWKDQFTGEKIHKHRNIHQIVANYFCEKDLVEKYGENAVEVHHKIRYPLPDTDSQKRLMEYSMIANNSKNLEYELDDIHIEMTTQLQLGRYKVDPNDPLMQFVADNVKLPCTGVSVQPKENGGKKITLELHFGNGKKYKDLWQKVHGRPWQPADFEASIQLWNEMGEAAS